MSNGHSLTERQENYLHKKSTDKIDRRTPIEAHRIRLLRTMDIIWLLLRSSWVSVAVAVVSGLASGTCSAMLIALINTTISAAPNVSTAFTTGAAQSPILPFIGLALLSLGTGALSQFLLIDLAQDSVFQLQIRLSQRILAAPLQQLEALGPSKLLAVLTEDVQSISNSVFVLPFLCIDAAVICGCLVYLGVLSGWGLLVVTVFFASAIALVQLLIRATYGYIALARKEIDRLFENFRGVTEGTKELKLNAVRRQRFLEEDLQKSAAITRDYTKTAFKLAAVSTGSGQLLFFTLIGIMLFWVPNTFPSIRPVLPAYILTLTYVISYIEGLLRRLPNLLTANVSIQKVNKMGLTLTQNAEISTASREPTIQHWQTITLKDIIHTYQNADTAEAPDSAFSVGPINLTITRGELIFIVGGNGSGKSTLAKLLAGLYVPDSGKLLLDKTPIVGHNRERYRQLFSTVFSDFYLFKKIASAETPTVDKQAQLYLSKLQLTQKVSVENGQLSTTALSQGQRKRLALLAAYLENRPIYLFDEWAADQDPSFRQIFYTQLLPELKHRGKTVIVISHDDHYFSIADRIIKLHYGRIEKDTKQ